MTLRSSRPALAARKAALAAGLAVAAAVAGGGGPAGAQGGAADRVAAPAVAIRSPAVLTPAEMAGSGIDPEVQVRVEIDETGVARRVEVSSIEPPSRFDELLRQSVTQTLERWRFGPARDAEDNPVPSSLSWRMKFLSGEKARQQSGSSALNGHATLRALVGSGHLPANFRFRTRQERADALKGSAASAEKHIDRTRRRRSETPRFIAISDAEDESTVDVLAGNMEAVFNAFHSVFDEHVEPMPQGWKLVVYLYGKESSLKRLVEDVGVHHFAAGFYQSPGLLAFHQESPYYDSLMGAMLHEAFHAYSDSHLLAPGRVLPRWAEEGLAEYFGNSKVEGGRLLPGESNQGRYVIVPGLEGAMRERSESTWSVRDARQALRQGEAPTIADLFDADPDTFYGDEYQRHYGFSWLLVHFLRHGRESWESGEPFARLLLYLTEEYPSRDALQAVYGARPEELQDEFERYVRRF